MKITNAYLRRVCREPYLRLCDDWLAAFFCEKRDDSVIARWRAYDRDLYPGSRRGLVGLWTVARNAGLAGHCHPAHVAALTASVWVEGKQQHACIEFGVCEPGWLIEAMRPFRLSPVLMSASELEDFARLPETVTLFRGGGGGEDAIRRGFSWTTDRAIAELFAEMRGGEVVTAQVPKGELLALFTDRENEAVLADGWPGVRLRA